MAETSERPQLFWMSGSPYAWRALLALEVKGVAYEPRLLQWSSGELKTPAFLALNPRGRVPVLRDGDTVVRESVAIMAYLDRRHPEPALFGASAAEAAAIWQTIMECVNYLDPAVEHATQPIFFGEPEPDWAAHRAAVHAELAGFERTLGGSAWLAGPRLSAADLAVYPMVRLLLRAVDRATPELDLGLRPLAASYPWLAGWMVRIEALPGYDRTFPPHWR